MFTADGTYYEGTGKRFASSESRDGSEFILRPECNDIIHQVIRLDVFVSFDVKKVIEFSQVGLHDKSNECGCCVSMTEEFMTMAQLDQDSLQYHPDYVDFEALQ